MTRKLRFVAAVFVGVALLVGGVALFTPWWLTACLETEHALNVILPLCANFSMDEVSLIREKYNGTVNCYDFGLVWMEFLAPYINGTSVFLGIGQDQILSKLTFGLLVIGLMILLLPVFVLLVLSTLPKYSNARSKSSSACCFPWASVWGLIFGDIAILAALLTYTISQADLYNEDLFQVRVKPILRHVGNTYINKFNFEPIEYHPYSVYHVELLIKGPYFHFSFWLAWASFLCAVVGTVFHACALRKNDPPAEAPGSKAELSALQ